MRSQPDKSNTATAKRRVAAWIGLSDKKCLEKLKGLDDCILVDEGILFRQYPVAGLRKFRQICPPPIVRASAVAGHLYSAFVTMPRISRRI